MGRERDGGENYVAIRISQLKYISFVGEVRYAGWLAVGGVLLLMHTLKSMDEDGRLISNVFERIAESFVFCSSVASRMAGHSQVVSSGWQCPLNVSPHSSATTSHHLVELMVESFNFQYDVQGGASCACVVHFIVPKSFNFYFQVPKIGKIKIRHKTHTHTHTSLIQGASE